MGFYITFSGNQALCFEREARVGNKPFPTSNGSFDKVSNACLSLPFPTWLFKLYKKGLAVYNKGMLALNMWLTYFVTVNGKEILMSTFCLNDCFYRL